MDILFISMMPFVVAVLLAIPGLTLPKPLLTWGVAGFMTLLFVALVGYYPYVRDDGVVLRSVAWMPELGLNFSFYLDGLALLFGLVVTGAGAVIFLYTGYYFDEVAEQTRFTWLMMAFSGAMLGVVLSGNLITLFIMWELTSILSFLLISFKGTKEAGARRGAAQALIVTGGGGLALLAGLLLLGTAAGGTGGFTAELSAVLAAGKLTNHDWYTAITALILIGAFTKSAQFPFHFWLPGGMSAPTPASAFLHSATMVKAGVFLLARLYPVLGYGEFWTNAVMLIGLATMLVGSVFGIKQRDLKALLAYTTITQLGILVLLLGMPDAIGFKAAMIGILAHALYKAALFLMVGSVDHSMGTRNIDELGGVAKLMPITALISVISAVSMAGIPFFFGFVSKEVLIAAAMDVSAATWVILVVFISGALTATAAFILIWDVFFRKPTHEPHFHPLPAPIDIGPGVLAIGSLTFGFLLAPLVVPLVETAVPKAFELKLFPGFITEFYISLAAIAAGFGVFALRGWWLPRFGDLPISGAAAYTTIIRGVEWLGDLLLMSQNGKLRYYLISILGVLALIILASGLLVDLANSEQLLPSGFDPVLSDVLDVMLLGLAIISALVSVLIKRHLYAVLAVGVMGYAVGGIFLIEQAPDVALVQIVVETLTTVLVIIILSRTRDDLREAVTEKLWESHSGVGLWRDAAIAGIIGGCVFIFTLIATTNRPERETIAGWYLDNANPQVGANDVVAAILTDFRGTDTLLEISVFAMAALGILALFSINRQTRPLDKDRAKRTTLLDMPSWAATFSTPFSRVGAFMTLPLALLIALVHIAYGANAPGDGFTAGIIAGLGLALWYVVFGYAEIRKRLEWLHPTRFLSLGLLLALVNATWPLLAGETFMGYIKLAEYDPAGLKLSTTLIFEIAIALTVFGSVGMMLETVAHPDAVEKLRGDTDYGHETTDEGGKR